MTSPTKAAELAEKLADQYLLPLPTRMPGSIYKHHALGDLYDRLALHTYAAGYAHDCIKALLRASEGRVLEGWQLVPVEPTDHMLDVGKREAHRNNGAREKALRMFKAMAAAAPHPPAQQAEPLVRFCPGCGSVGEVEAKYRDCCPDGGRARMIPEPLARQCHDLFQAALKGASSPPPHKAEGAEPQKGGAR